MENRTEQWGPLQIKIKWEHDEYSDEVEADCIAEAKRMATEVIDTLSAGMTEAAEFLAAEVRLYEDNGGGLHIVANGTQWSGLEEVDPEGASFAEDAEAVILGDTNDWSMPMSNIVDVEDCVLIATFTGGAVAVEDAPAGVAGALYLHLEAEAVVA